MILGIRPEDFIRVEQGDASLHLHVDMVETLGADTLIHGHLARAETRFIVRLFGIHHLAKGTLLPLTMAPDKMHLFHPQTGQRLTP